MHRNDQRRLKLRRETLKKLTDEMSAGVAGGAMAPFSKDDTNPCNGASRYVNTVPQPCYRD